ncbi:aminoglycoside phosphotransferase [Paenibacillus sp. IHB B 3415]|uniref:phosphotransferase enzyme family protein n=1 Tax=Paenibacillus sp. IHB B 3415 TaxID=867080 RepID=UPI00057366CE|nr:phosphotransferase [Paenibacillus sp. IHB B 3415]KHL93006.1 aminoglycoside phosphotransferase [Paenibacillus sp. IHB B 3415]
MNNIVSQAWPEWNGTFRKRSGGWNNTTYFVDSETRRAVLRIYDTHRDRNKIEFEHAVLQRLAILDLPFKTPVPILTSTGETMVQLEEGEGKLACLFGYIDGESPAEQDSGFYESFGEAAGTLSAVLADVKPESPPVYRPYYELGRSYPLCTREALRDLLLNPPEPLQGLLPELKVLVEAYEGVADSLEQLEELPHQLVHGDLNASNLLVDTEDAAQVTALLDFEFCTWDVRAMEAAVILSGMLCHEEEERIIRDFWRGFSRKIMLTVEEFKAIPTLILLRKVDVFLHFVTRYWKGIDEVNVLQEQIPVLAAEVLQISGGKL